MEYPYRGLDFLYRVLYSEAMDKTTEDLTRTWNQALAHLRQMQAWGRPTEIQAAERAEREARFALEMHRR
jgi:hypothetical protein